MWNPFNNMFFPKRMVGVDIGTFSVKVVELSCWGQGRKLENYGEMQSAFIYKEPLSNSGKNNIPSSNLVSQAIRAILDESHIKTKAAIFSIPDFSTFCTSFDIPPMTEKEIPGAISYNASQYITLPISEVTLDWRIIPNSLGLDTSGRGRSREIPAERDLPTQSFPRSVDSKPRFVREAKNPVLDKNSLLKVFLVAVPNQVVQEYQTIARGAGLELYALEAEVFSITRALIKDSKKTICLMDIGAQSSTINIIDKGFLKRSYSFNFNSNQLSHAVSSALGLGYNESEEIKNKEGVISSRPGVAQTLYLLIDPLLTEIKSISAEFLQQEEIQVDEIYLTGGTANLPGLREYFAESLKKNVYVPNCFSGLLYPPILDQKLQEMSPRFSVAVGVALSGLEI